MPPYKLNPPPASLPPGSQILAYLRDSGHETQELSTQQQQNSLSEWASQHGLVITRFYIDEARVGSTSIGRDQLQLLMNVLRHGTPETAVVVWSYNRFSRGLDEPALYRGEIRTLKYQFHSLTDDVPEGPIGRIVEAVIDYKNYQYLVDLSIDIQRGQRDLVRIHGCVPGTPPRGILRQPVTLGQHRDGTPHIAHRWLPDPATSHLVRQAFEMRASGASLETINNTVFLYKSRSCYSSFFSNQIYIGTLCFSDMTIEKYCPPIVPLDIWQTVQDIQVRYAARQHVNSESSHPRRTASRYLLSGLLRCAQCDSVINGNTSSYRGIKATDTYACANVRRHKCTARRIPREQLETIVIETVITYITAPNAALARQELDATNAIDQASQTKTKREDLKKRLAKTHRDLKRISDAIMAHGQFSKTLSANLEALEKEEASYTNQINQLERTPASIQLDRIELQHQAALAMKILKAEDNLDEKRSLLRGFIYRIKVENAEKRIEGIIYCYSPINIKETEHPPPAVYISTSPPGAPLYIHSIAFETVYKVGTPRTKKTRS